MIFWILIGLGGISLFWLLGYLWLKFKPTKFAPFAISVIMAICSILTVVNLLSGQQKTNINIELINAKLQILKAQTAEIDKLKSEYAKFDELETKIARVENMKTGSLHTGPTVISGGLTIRSGRKT